MVIKVVLLPHDVQNILMAHIQEKFKNHAGQGEYLQVMRLGEPAQEMEFSVEAKRLSVGIRD